MKEITMQGTGRQLLIGLVIVQIFIGLGAIGGGAALVLDPSGAILGTPIEMLETTPFSNFLIPGMILLVVIGVGHMIGGALSLVRYRHFNTMAMILGVILIIWLLAQIWWFQSIHWLHTTYLVLGIVELAIGLLLRQKSIHLIDNNEE